MTDGGLLLLDTSVVLHLVRGKATGLALDRAFGLRARVDRPLISIITVGELLAFARQRQWGASKVEHLKTLIEQLVVVDVRNHGILDRYAEIDAFLVARGRALGDNDTWIAATAAATRAVLLTADRDFDAVHEVFLQRLYFDPAVTPRSSS